MNKDPWAYTVCGSISWRAAKFSWLYSCMPDDDSVLVAFPRLPFFTMAMHQRTSLAQLELVFLCVDCLTLVASFHRDLYSSLHHLPIRPEIHMTCEILLAFFNGRCGHTNSHFLNIDQMIYAFTCKGLLSLVM